MLAAAIGHTCGFVLPCPPIGALALFGAVIRVLALGKHSKLVFNAFFVTLGVY
jgi:hypothetical protein